MLPGTQTSGQYIPQAITSPLKAIKAKCLECAGRLVLVRNCNSGNCPLFPYRLGSNPRRRGIGGGLANFKRSFTHLSGKNINKTGTLEAAGVT